MPEDERKQEGKQKENKNPKPFLIGLGIVLLASIAIYNYDMQLGFANGESGSFLYRALYAIEGALGAIVKVFEEVIGKINLYLGTEFWSVVVVLIVFIVLAIYISKE